MSFACTDAKVPWIDTQAKAKSDIWNCSVEFKDGKKYEIIAPSGKGKTTFIQFLYGLIREYSGSAAYADQDFSDMDHYAWAAARKEEISIVFQDLRLFDSLNGMENIEIKNRLCSCLTRDEIEKKANTLGIGGILGRKCASYSLGEKQRLAFLRALCQPFKWILMDEPFSHVDKDNKKIMVKMLLEQVKKNKAGIIATFLGPEPAVPWDEELHI